jgi:hypothetical protein
MVSKVLGSMRGVYIAAMNKRALLPSLMLVLSCGANEPGVQSATEVAREVTTGMRSRARVQVSVKASAEDPGQEDLDLRKKIEDRIEQQNIGRLVSSGGGAGFVDITVEVDNTADAIEKIQEIVRSLDVARETSFKVLPEKQ